MLKNLLHWLGLEKLTDYEKKYIAERNIKSATFMAFITIVLELYMIYSLMQIILHPYKPLTNEWIFLHLYPYCLLLGIAVILFV